MESRLEGRISRRTRPLWRRGTLSCVVSLPLIFHFLALYYLITNETCRLSVGEDCFERGNEFLPERWFEKPEMIRNKAAYAPFGTGKIYCLLVL
jgi:hypothetical protein